jgi:hypothetical protein
MAIPFGWMAGVEALPGIADAGLPSDEIPAARH